MRSGQGHEAPRVPPPGAGSSRNGVGVFMFNLHCCVSVESPNQLMKSLAKGKTTKEKLSGTVTVNGFQSVLPYRMISLAVCSGCYNRPIYHYLYINHYLLFLPS